MTLAATLNRLAEKPSRRVIGLISGTSVDGIDAALVSVAGGGAEARVRLDAFRTYPFPSTVRRAIFEAFDPTTGTVEHLTHLNFVLGAVFAEAALSLARDAGVPSATILPLDALGWDADAKEAVAFALLANDALLGLPTSVPGATGARRAVTLGKVCWCEPLDDGYSR